MKTDVQFYLLDLERSTDGQLSWWKANEAGYTAVLSHAGLYTWPQVLGLLPRGIAEGRDVPIPPHIARSMRDAVAVRERLEGAKNLLRDTVAQCLECHAVQGEAKFQAALVATGIALGSALAVLKLFDLAGDSDVLELSRRIPICKFRTEQ